ncbi:MAG: ABC transporter permease, partial [Proteobacteria bacterium]|nr:ABC transporter permease [Pseudomonadota bacterium]
MLAFIIKRLLLAALIVVIAVVLMFIMVHAVPGDPVSVMLGPRASVELKAHLIERMGLNEPLFWQIILFFRGLLNGDMGVDVFSNRQVADIVFEQLPYTLELIFASIIWSALLGISLGVYAAARRGSLIDKITAVLSVGCVAAPAFVVALLLLLFFSVYLQWFPAIGIGDSENFSGRISHLVLPSLAIGLSWVGYIARLVRAAMLEILTEPYIRTAQAFGLPPS